jgi:phage shock protein PspC (stress-responsive transcriptional regulator)
MDEHNFPNIFEQQKEDYSYNPIHKKKLERSNSNRIIAGTCSGIGKYFNTDVSVIRIFAILCLLLGLWSVVVYFILSLTVPAELETQKISDEEKELQRKINFRTVTSGILMLTGIYFGFSSFGLHFLQFQFFFSGGIFSAIILIGIGIFIYTSNSQTPTHLNSPHNFTRSGTDKIIAGVCGGLAKYLSIDSHTVRIVFVILTALTLGLFSIPYLAIAFFTFQENKSSIDDTA